MKAYSRDLRERVLKGRDGGVGAQAAAGKYPATASRVRRLEQRRRRTKQVAPAQQRHGPEPSLQAAADKTRVAVREAPDPTLREYIARYPLPPSKSAPARGLAARGLPRKKGRPGPASRAART